ncbi:hypothetical protein [Vibrio parahaemolyticus]|uniref:hypothetical protein n=1 Tax=Vibrio parahaemolyticus TaxID=670 RepID=UPI000471FB0D|nr:hypothetical protein [Vibrio parahaemolyticus]
MTHLYLGNLALSPTLLEGSDYKINTDDLSKWRANWLDGSFTDNIWKLKNCKIQLNYNAQFVNGDNLTTPKYASLLNTIKKIVFLKRSGHLADIQGKQTTRSQHQYQLSRELIALAQYLVNKGLYEEGRGFAGMTKSRFNDYVKLFVKGGRDAVSGHRDIIKNELQKLRDSGRLDEILDKNGVFNSKKFVSLTGVSSEIVDNLTATSKDSLKVFCLFKDHAQSVGGIKTEFNNATPLKTARPSSKVQTSVDDEDYMPSKISDSRISSLVAAVNTLSDFQIPLKESEMAFFTPFVATLKDYEHWYYTSRRTPNIPNNIALSYIDAAVEFVHSHGENLVSTLADCKEQMVSLREIKKKSKRDYLMKFIKIPVNSTTEHFNVNRYNLLATSANIQEKRDNVTVEILLEIFQTSVFILLTTFACKRFQDVIPVKHAANTIGYTGLNFIKFGLSKADPIEVLRAVGRPVPKVVADAFDNLVEINRLLLDEPTIPSLHLFQANLTIPSDLSLLQDKVMSRDILIRRLINFADFLEIPTVNVGGVESRWYLNRIHMLRRFFACAYYHTQDKEHLPALTWLMGHADTQQTMHYVTQNLSNSEMTSTEAASVVATVMSDLDEENDVIKELSNIFGKHTKGVTIARNERILERRINELIKKGYRIVREISGDLVLLKTYEEPQDAA